MLERDQAARNAPPRTLMAEMREVDAANNARIIEIIRDSGWPSFSRVGRDAALAAFVLTQHLPTGHETQLVALKLMEPLLGQGEADRQAFAYLYDRTHRPQRFGTQGDCVAQGLWEAREIENRGTVDQRRAEVGMEPLAIYAGTLGKHLCTSAQQAR